MTEPSDIIWHLDPTVAATARLGDYGADVWDNCDGTHGWVVRPIAGPSNVPAQQAPDFEAAKLRAARELIAHAEAPGGMDPRTGRAPEDDWLNG